jgi:serine phosphatase RsbU (regulator of sigma subunit)
VLALAAGFSLYRASGLLLDASTPALGLAVTFAAVLGMTLAETQAQRRMLRQQLADEREAAARVAGELEAARRIQMGILPDPAAALAGESRAAVYAFLEPARTVGGDLYDVFRLDDGRLFFLVGDVAGKGVPGSLFMAVSKALCKSSALRVTAWAGVLDVATGRLTCCNAGHEPAWLLNAAGRELRRLAEDGGPPLCVMDDYPYATTTYELRPGDTLCLVTDGVTEAMDEQRAMYGRARVDGVLAKVPAGASVAEVGEAIRRDVQVFAAGAEPSDDLTILVVRWVGPADPGPAPRGNLASPVSAP